MNRCTLLLAFAGLLLIGLPLSGAAQDPDCIWCQQCMNEERFRTTSDVTGDVEVLRIWANCSAMDEYQCADLIPCEPLHTPEEEALLEAELEALVFAGDRLGLRSLLFSRGGLTPIQWTAEYCG